MASSIGELVINLKVNSAEFIREMDKSRTVATTFGVATGTILADLAGRFTRFAMDAASAFPRLIVSVAELGDRLGDTSEKTGLAVENLSGLNAVSHSVGESFDGLSTALARAGVNITKALDEPSAKANQRLIALMGGAKGATELGLKPMDDRIQTLLKSIFALNDVGERNVALQQLLGKGWQSNMETLQLLATQGYGPAIEQAKAFGMFYDAEAAAKAQEFGLQMKALEGLFMGLAKTMALQVMPSILDAAKAANIWIQAWMNQGFWKGLFQNLDTGIQKWGILKQLSAPGRFVAGTLLGYEPGAQAAEMARVAAELDAQIAALSGGGRGRNAMAETGDDADKASKASDKARKARLDLILSQQLMSEEMVKSIKATSPYLLQLEALSKAEEKFAESIKKTSPFLNPLDLKGRGGLIKPFELNMGNVEEELTNINIQVKEYPKISDAAREATERWSREMASLTSNIGTAFEDAVLGGDGLRNIFIGLADEVERFSLRLLVINPLMEKLFGTINASGQSSGGWLSSIFGAVSGAVGGLFGGGAGAVASGASGITPGALARFGSFAAGGIQESDGLALVHAKEMVLPPILSDGIQRMVANGGGRPIQIVQQISIDARGAQQGVEQNLRTIMRESQQEAVAMAIAAMRDLQLRTA